MAKGYVTERILILIIRVQSTEDEPKYQQSTKSIKQFLVEFLDDLWMNLPNIYAYHAKCSGQYLKTRKENLSRTDA